MIRVSLNPGRTPVLDRNQYSAGIRAIVRTSSMNDVLHGPVDYTVRCSAGVSQAPQFRSLVIPLLRHQPTRRLRLATGWSVHAGKDQQLWGEFDHRVWASDRAGLSGRGWSTNFPIQRFSSGAEHESVPRGRIEAWFCLERKMVRKGRTHVRPFPFKRNISARTGSASAFRWSR